MRINDAQIRRNLETAYKGYSHASSEADFQVALLGLHTALENALRSYLKAFGVSGVDYHQVSFPDLVDMVRDKTDLFAGDPGVVRLLVSLNTTRNGIAHPDEGKPSAAQIENDARQFAKLIQRFWPSFFEENFPASLQQSQPAPVRQPPPSRPPEAQHVQESAIHPSIRQHNVEPARTGPNYPTDRIVPALKKLWVNEREPRLRKSRLIKRLIGVYLLFTVATWLTSASFSTARWPQPVKPIAVVVFILAGAVFLWGCIVAGKILAQLRLKRLLLFFSFLYIFYVAVVLLTSDSSMPISQQFLITNRRLVDNARTKTMDAVFAVLDAPAQFRSAYTGHGTPVNFAFLEEVDASYLTPIPANSGSESTSAENQINPPTTSTPLPQFNGPNANFSNASIYSIGFLENGNLLVTIQVPGGISGEYQGYIQEQAFKCSILAAYPDRLYCNGPGFGAGQRLTISIHELASDEIVYEAEFTVPP